MPHFSRSLPILKVADIQIRVHWSWLILGLLVASSLATAWYPLLVPGRSAGIYWFAALIGALGLLISIALHELSHALVGRSHRMSVHNITLFLFGGIAQLDDEPPTPKAEFQMAIAGPLASLALCLVFLGLYLMTVEFQGSALLAATFSYFASINLVVAVFNMIPGFPMDGGRVLRSILWHFKRDLLWSTRIAAAIGQGFGLLLMGLALVNLFAGQGFGALWPFFLGLLIMGLARASYAQLLIKQTLHDQPAERFMDRAPFTVRPDTPISDMMNAYLNRDEQSVYPVIGEDRQFLGCVDLKEARKFPEREWKNHRVEEIVRDCSVDQQISGEADAEEALSKMTKTGARELVVVQDTRLLGVIKQTALLRYLSLQGTQGI